MTDGAAAFPPLWPGSMTTTLPSRIPVAVRGNRAEPPPAAIGSTGGEAGLLRCAGSGGRLADVSGEPGAAAREAAGAPRPGAEVEAVDEVGAATRAVDATLLQALTSMATAGRVHANRRIRSPYSNRSAARSGLHRVPDAEEGVLGGRRRARGVL